MEENTLNKPEKVIVIGGSAGSLEVLLKVLGQLDNIPGIAIVIVVHRKSADDNRLEELFRMKTRLPIKEIQDKTLMKSGRVHIAPADYHLLFEADGSFALDVSEKVNFSRPSIDIAFESAAMLLKKNLTAVLLSGANSDGTNGLLKVRENNGTIIIQSPETAEMPYMPSFALQHLDADHIFSPDQMATFMKIPVV